MNCWIRPPVVVIPESCPSPDSEPVDGWYLRICRAFTQPNLTLGDDFILPRAGALNAEELAACAIRQALTFTTTDGSSPVEVLVDCRSSAAIGGSAPTYVLCAKANLRSVLPFSLSGQAGVEGAQGLYFAARMMRSRAGSAVLSTVQRIVPPDSRHMPSVLPLADAAAAVVASASPVSKGFRLYTVELGRQGPDDGENVRVLLKSALMRAQLERQAVAWTINHRFSAEFDQHVRASLPTANWLIRERQPEFNFGCADPLISLHSIFAASPTPPTGIGVLWFRGLHGALAAVILEATV